MRNFGDLMFPVLARERLAPHGFRLTAFAPTGSDPGLGLEAPRPIAELFTSDPALDGILIGGGYIIHTQPVSRIVHLVGQDTAAGRSELVDCWAGATLWAALRGLPIAWNAPGVPFPFATGQLPAVAAVAGAADYLSVRDQSSAGLLDPDGKLAPAIVPDPIAEIARFWPRSRLAAAEAAFRARVGLAPEAAILALHIRDRSLSGYGADKLGQRIGEFATAHKLVPVLLALGQAHDDGATAREVARHIASPHIVLEDPPSLMEIAAVTAAARLYIGASLHGYIAATSYGVPAALIARPAYGKFAGYVAHAGWPGDLCRDWDAGLAQASALLAGPPQRPLPDRIGNSLDDHWTAIAAALAAGTERRAARTEFVRRYVNLGVGRRGTGWATSPLQLGTKGTH